MKQRKTRNQRKRERRQTAASVVLLVALWGAVGVLTVRALDHPGEQPISGSEYMEQVGRYVPDEPKLEQIAAPVVQQIETPEPVKLYDVPLDADLQNHIAVTCEAHHIDPAVVVAMIWQESRYNPDAVGDSGNAFGLMQIWPYWHSGRMAKLGCDDLLDPFQNVTVGVDYLAAQLRRYDGDLAAAVTAYNKGHYAGTVTGYAKSVLAKADELRGESNA